MNLRAIQVHRVEVNHIFILDLQVMWWDSEINSIPTFYHRRVLFEKVSTMGNVLFYLSLQTTSELIEQESVVDCTYEVNTADIQGCFTLWFNTDVPLQRDEWLDGEGNAKK